MSVTFDFNCPPYPRGYLIMHKGIPLYAGDHLLTPHSFCLWFPTNWLFIVVFSLRYLVLWALSKYHAATTKEG